MTLIAVAQITSTPSIPQNIKLITKFIQSAIKQNAKIIFFPEASDYIAPNAQISKSLATPYNESPLIKSIIDLLKLNQKKGNLIDVVIGIHEPSNDALNRTKNTCLYINSNGELLQRYQKIHLFDVNIKNGPILQESKSVEPGDSILPPFKTPIGMLGLAICYDLRFPELSLTLRSQNAQILTFPSAWTVKTGPQFHTLGKAIAILTQCYVILPAQVGVHCKGRESYGGSCVIDPLGNIIGMLKKHEVLVSNNDDNDNNDDPNSDNNNENGILIADIDLELVDNTRKNMPLWNQRRYDVYPKLG